MGLSSSSLILKFGLDVYSYQYTSFFMLFIVSDILSNDCIFTDLTIQYV